MNNENLTLSYKKSIFTNPVVITLVALLCCALWGSATPFIKLGYQYLLPEKDIPSTFLFAGLRFAMAGVLTIVIFSIARRKFVAPKLNRKSLCGIATLAVFQTILQYTFFYIGLANTTGVKGTVASSATPFFSIIITTLILKQERLTFKKIAACVLGIAGILLINLDGFTFDMNFLGDAFVLFSSISSSVAAVLIKIFSKDEDPVALSGYQFMIGGAFLIVLGLVTGGRINTDSVEGIFVLIYLAFLSAVAYSLWGILLKYNPVSKISVFTFSTPVMGVLLSALFLPDEKMVPVVNLLITLALVTAGILLLNYQRPAKAEKGNLGE